MIRKKIKNFSSKDRRKIFKKLLNNLIKISVYLLIFLIPLIVSPFSFEVYEFGKQYLLVFLVSFATICWLSRMVIVEKEIRFWKTPFDLPVLAVAGVSLLSSIFSVDRLSSFFGSYGRFSDGLISLLSFCLFYFLLTNHLRRRGVEDENLVLRRGKLTTILFVSTFFVILLTFASLFKIWEKIPFSFPNFIKRGTFNPISASFEGEALFLAFVLFLAVGEILIKRIFPSKKVLSKLKVKNFLSGLVLIFGLSLLVLIGYKNAWMILAVGLFSFSFFVLVKRIIPKENIDKFLLPIFLLLLSIFFVFVNSKELISSLTLISGEKDLISFSKILPPEENLLSFSDSLEIAKNQILKGKIKTKIIGSGIGTFFYDFSKFRPKSLNQKLFWALRYDRSSNHIFEVIATQGILGVLAYLLFLEFLIYFAIYFLKKRFVEKEVLQNGFSKPPLKKVVVIDLKEGKGVKKVVRQERKDLQENIPSGSEALRCEFCLALYLSLLISIFVSWFLYYQNTSLQLIFWLSLGFFSSAVLDKEKNKLKIISLEKSPEALLVFNVLLRVIILAFAVSIFLGVKVYLADFWYKKGAIILDIKQIDKKIERYEKAVRQNGWQAQYRISLARAYLNRALEEGKKRKEEANRVRIQLDIQRAVEEAKRATELSPNRVSAWETRGMVYRELIGLAVQADEWAIRSFKKAIGLEPTNPLLHLELGKLYLNKAREKKFEKKENLRLAREEFNKALELKPDLIDAKIQLALLLETEGKIKEAIEKLEELKSSFSLTTPVLSRAEAIFQLGRLYFNQGKIDKAMREFKEAIRLNPNFANARYSLGICYQQKGEKEKAIQEFKKVLELNPGNEEVRKRLEELGEKIE